MGDASQFFDLMKYEIKYPKVNETFSPAGSPH